jgi:hypothetical protein
MTGNPFFFFNFPQRFKNGTHQFYFSQISGKTGHLVGASYLVKKNQGAWPNQSIDNQSILTLESFDTLDTGRVKTATGRDSRATCQS